MTESSGMRTPGTPSRWIRLAGLAALAILCAAALRGWALRNSQPSGAPAAGARDGASPVVTPPPQPRPGRGGAAKQRPPDPGSSSAKHRWVEDVPGVDLADLDPAHREIFVRFANAERCTCGCGYTLAACRVYDSTCEVSLPRIETLLDSVRDGRLRDVRGLRPRPGRRPASMAPTRGEPGGG